VAVVELLLHFLLRESNNRRMPYGLALAGHVVIALVLLLGVFKQTEPAPVDAASIHLTRASTFRTWPSASASGVDLYSISSLKRPRDIAGSTSMGGWRDE
jgi:hypothetical protein